MPEILEIFFFFIWYTMSVLLFNGQEFSEKGQVTAVTAASPQTTPVT